MKFNRIPQIIMSLSRRFFSLFVILLLLPWFVQAKATLPENLKWETNYDDPALGDPNAKRGGTFRTYILNYPSTFRLVGPGSNGSFAHYTRAYGLFSLTDIHPTTLRTIPILATHWAIMDDKKTVYYKLNRKAKWSDGKPITADDYVFTGKLYRSKWIQDPYTNKMMEETVESIEKIDAYTLKIVSKKPSWRILYEQSLTPMPKHATKLDKGYLKRYQWKYNVVPGPYIIKRYKNGKWVQFDRLKKWWGEEEHYFKGLYNFDKIRVKVIRNQDVALELFKRGKLDHYRVASATKWARETEFEEVKKGYVNKQRIFNQSPDGLYGIGMNVQDVMLTDARVRRALAHLYDFETLNKKLMFNAYTRKHLFFETLAPYRHPTLKTWEFDIDKANKLLDEAGWTEFNEQGVRTKNGKPLRLVMNYGSKSFTRVMTIYKEAAKKAGIDIQLKAMDGATSWKTNREKKHQLTILSMGVGVYPAPKQYLHSSFKKPETNNFFMLGDKEVDRLIDIFENSDVEQERVNAILKLEELLREKAILIPFFKGDFIRLLWWRQLQMPKERIHKAEVGNMFPLHDSWWFSKEEKKKLKQYKKARKSFERLPVDYDPYNVRDTAK